MSSSICQEAAIKANLSKKDISSLLDLARETSKIGGEVLMDQLGKIKSIQTKSCKTDLVTNADLEAEEKIIKYLNSNTPEITILAEETGLSAEGNSLTWCIDPLDGTTNYANGYPFFATSIGLLWQNQPILGAICIPFINEIFTGAPGIGSFCNSDKIKVSNKTKLEDSLLVTGFSYDRKSRTDNNYAEFAWLTHITRGVRRGGAAAVDLAFVANGRLDGYWERGLAKWDLAAGVPIVEMAGGQISNYPTGEFDISNGRILAASPSISKELKEELLKVKPLEKRFFCEQEL